MAAKKLPDKFVISTKTFETLEGARKQIQEWNEQDDLRPGTRVFRVIEVYEVLPAEIKLKKVKSYV